MTEGRSAKSEDVEMEDAIGFLRKSALVEDKSGNPALTAKGERFLQELEESSGSPGESSSSDDPTFSEGTISE
jgi:hypothetical protein